MRIVHLKLTCPNPDAYFSQLKYTKYFWIYLIVEQIFSTSVQIFGFMMLADSRTMLALKITNRVLSFLTEGILIYLQWYYIKFFIDKKKIRMDFELKPIQTKTKILFFWLYFVLTMNTINYIAYNATETVLDLVDLEQSTKILILLQINRVSMFWFDTLNLSNGIIFLLLFKSMV
jgi:hypothetical protein